MNLSVVFAVLNEPHEAIATIWSIRATAGDKVQIVVVDDASTTPLAQMYPREKFMGAIVLTNAYRCGCGPSRHIGVTHATGDYVLICDAHMRFRQGWYEQTEKVCSEDRAKWCGLGRTIWCAQCLALDSKHMDVDHPTGSYKGGTLNILGPDKANPGKIQVLEGIWLPPPVYDNQAIACVMGAGYLMTRKWFLELGALKNLRSWGCDEQMLSIKSWLAGGDCRYAETIQIGHKFLLKGEKQGFRVPAGDTTWNKLYAIHTLFPGSSGTLVESLKKTVPGTEWMYAQTMLRRDWFMIEEERACNRRLFVRDMKWLADKFRLNLP